MNLDVHQSLANVKIWYVYVVEYYQFMKMNVVLSFEK